MEMYNENGIGNDLLVEVVVVKSLLQIETNP